MDVDSLYGLDVNTETELVSNCSWYKMHMGCSTCFKTFQQTVSYILQNVTERQVTLEKLWTLETQRSVVVGTSGGSPRFTGWMEKLTIAL